MSTVPLRVRFSLVVAVVVAIVLGAPWWLSLRGGDDMLEGLERLHAAVDVRVEAASEQFRQQSVKIADTHREIAVWSEELARAGRLAALAQAAANMAHRIGTPLNLISTHVQLLMQSPPPRTDSLDRLKAQNQVARVAAIVRGPRYVAPSDDPTRACREFGP